MTPTIYVACCQGVLDYYACDVSVQSLVRLVLAACQAAESKLHTGNKDRVCLAGRGHPLPEGDRLQLQPNPEVGGDLRTADFGIPRRTAYWIEQQRCRVARPLLGGDRK